MSVKLETKMRGFSSEEKFESTAEGVFKGYLAVFGNVDSYGDRIEPGAFKESLRAWKKKGYYPPMLSQHAAGYTSQDLTPVGKWTLMKEDDYGLYVEGKLFSTVRGNDLKILLLESDPGAMGMSIGYSATEVEYPSEKEARATGCWRILKSIDLREGSIVTFPANDKAVITEAKSDASEAECANIREFERMLHKSFGVSCSDAKAIVSKAKDIFGIKSEKPTVDDVDDEDDYDEEDDRDGKGCGVRKKPKKEDALVEEDPAPDAKSDDVKDVLNNIKKSILQEEEDMEFKRMIAEMKKLVTK